MFTYHKARLLTCQRIKNDYHFTYSVHLDQPIVFLQQIRRVVEF